MSKAAIGPSAKVCIAIPSGEQWHAAFAMCTTLMILDTMTYPTPGWGGITTAIRNIRGSMLWKQRADLVQGALDLDCTHLLFVDSDQTFPANTLRRLLHHKKPVVACNVATKQYPSSPTARKWHNKEPWPVFTTVESTGLEEVWRIGTGIMMVDLSIIKNIPKPWFKVSWGDEGEQYGEDWWFCQQIEEAGYPIFIDHDLSKEIGHIGSMTYTHNHIPEDMRLEIEAIMAEGSKEEKGSLLATATRRLEDKALKSSV